MKPNSNTTANDRIVTIHDLSRQSMREAERLTSTGFTVMIPNPFRPQAASPEERNLRRR